MRSAGLGVVFTDADNMFHKDPFAPGGSQSLVVGSRVVDLNFQGKP